MAGKVSSFSGLIQRVTASCLLHPLGTDRFYRGQATPDRFLDDEEEGEGVCHESSEEEEDGEIENGRHKCKSVWEEREESKGTGESAPEREAELVVLMGQVFEAVSAVKRAYAGLQEAHSPWDPEKIRVADEAVVAELRRIGMLRERFKRDFGGKGRRRGVMGAETVREVVAPYEAAVEDLKREVKAKELEVENLKEKLKSVMCASGQKGRRPQSKRKVSHVPGEVPLSPSPDLFQEAMSTVTETSKSFTSLLHSLMRSARWDITAAARYIEASAATTDPISPRPNATASPTAPGHAKYALESYISRKMFQGFDHETFYMDGTLCSLLKPEQFRRDCLSKYRDMKFMDPAELLGILPTCQFGVFCTKKYLSIVHPKMEESLFGNLEQRGQILAGNHPRTQFYGEFLGLAKAVWLLHLLAFSLDPPPSHFEASRGAEFHPLYMESVVRYPGGKVPSGQVVAFSIRPGFKLGASGSVIKARVYLVPKS
ncbi:hypothetical protein Nepgr_013019 [Nepenthes gracilis]|uniref:DUF641 domain-containing protein n=1 Tax=Nepenthes gracilis TaxID=150966 RepID=A0AAD3SH49_NEPGR|nr:hypothetical protein Nepgr_013019 [Nepenthes gracilis]